MEEFLNHIYIAILQNSFGEHPLRKFLERTKYLIVFLTHV